LQYFFEEVVVEALAGGLDRCRTPHRLPLCISRRMVGW
jgi:hypothetical protein